MRRESSKSLIFMFLTFLTGFSGVGEGVTSHWLKNDQCVKKNR